MLGKSIIRHVLGNEKPLIAVAAETDQNSEPWMAQLADAGSLFDELLGIRPSRLAELLDGNPAAMVLEATLVNKVGCLLPTLRHDIVRAEIVGGRLQLSQRELREGEIKALFLGLREPLVVFFLFLFRVSLPLSHSQQHR